ncbi:unnamed protein product [Mytilus coruscus]|uniref:Uncharacterized protein n=1 Tax=Mytilus coruscus TaxID=42192 RepID=A0A6J8AJ95_MYTCO|nr:unnamed protein product [Mytilus coruscus]
MPSGALEDGNYTECLTNHVLRQILYEVEINEKDITKEKNVYCILPAMTVIDSYIPIFPMWSGIMLLEVEGITRDSNATIENWFRTMKENILQGRKRLAPGNFIRQIHKVIKGSVREYEATMKPVLRKKGVKLQSTENIELHEETWKRKKNTNGNSSYYCTLDKIPEPKYTKVSPARNNGIENKANNCWLNPQIKV